MENIHNTDEFKVQLEKELETLTHELESLGRKNPNNPSDWEATAEDDPISHPADPSDTADQKEEYEERAGILNQLEIRWNEVKHALERIEKGTYGTCEISGEPIELERLEANPAARTCIAHMNETLS